MMEWLAALEGSGFPTWLRESNTIWAYPTVLTLHTVGLGLLVGANWLLDLRILGLWDGIPLSEMSRSFRVMWIGFWVNAITGVMLFAADATTKGSTKLFIGKLGLVLVGVIVIMMTRRSVFSVGLPPAVTRTGKALAVTSLVVWVAAIAAGRFMAYI